LRVEEVDRIFFTSLYIEKAPTTQRKKGERCTNGKVNLCRQYTTAQKDVVAIAQGPKDIDTGTWNTCIDDTSKKGWLLIDRMSGDKTAERVCHDYSTSLLLGHSRFVAR
jgi:hypothetical protein